METTIVGVLVIIILINLADIQELHHQKWSRAQLLSITKFAIDVQLMVPKMVQLIYMNHVTNNTPA